MIHMQDITFIRGDRTILNGVNFHVQDGEQWVILGRNGSGKTTLLEFMNGYQFPSSGTVDVLGNRYGQCDVREVRKKIGYISQSLMEMLTLRDPVWEVVATGEYAFLRFYQEIPAEVKEKALRLIDEVGLLHTAEQPLATLSQGERKKIMLARALMQDPKLLIMDEPCAGLDLYEREKLLVDLDNLRKRDVTVIYVTHHIEEIMPLFTHVALVSGGRIAAAGPKEEVLHPSILSEAYELPIEVDWQHGRPWIRVVPSEKGATL